MPSGSLGPTGPSVGFLEEDAVFLQQKNRCIIYVIYTHIHIQYVYVQIYTYTYTICICVYMSYIHVYCILSFFETC